MTPNAASSVASVAAAAVVALTLLGSLLPTSSFVPAASRGQIPRHSSRRPASSSSSLSTSPQMSTPPPLPHNRRRQQPHSCFIPTTTTGERWQQRQRRPSSYRGVGEGVATSTSLRLPSLPPLSLGGMDMDDVDPLEAGPDPDAVLLQGEPETLRQQQAEEEYDAELAAAEAATASAKKAPTKKQIAEEAVAAAVAQMGEEGGADEVTMASLNPKKGKTARIRIDPLMPRGGVAPNEWAEMENLAEGVRGILVVCHTGLPRDKKRAAEVMQAVRDRYGHVIHTYEWWDENEELTDDDREDMGTFEVWLEGPTVVHYHERADGKVDLDNEQLEKILDDLECRVVDEAILGQYVNEDFQFRLPGFRASEQRRKQFPVL